MRWIDIVLPPAGVSADLDTALDRARHLLAALPQVQERDGLDGPGVVPHMAQVGQALFAGLTALDPQIFRPDPDRPGGVVPASGQPDVDCLTGYHVVADPEQLDLPWHWLHNGVDFLLLRQPLCAAAHPSRVPEVDPQRLWMQRYSEALFDQHDAAPAAGDDRMLPEVLFVPGHGNDEIRRLMFREADAIETALRGCARPRVRMRMPGAVTPHLLAARAMLYQGLHFTAPTSQPSEVSGAGENRWLSGLVAGLGTSTNEAIDELMGLELEAIGIDPVDAVLDHVNESFDHHRAEARAGGGEPGSTTFTGVATSQSAWLLDDGPVLPESLGRGGSVPPFVFSNSYCSLTWLGSRFTAAGASTFVGPAAPVFSRPARRWAAHFYGALGDGLPAAVAARRAALALREELGPRHPAWLSYGVVGYGSLSLSYL